MAVDVSKIPNNNKFDPVRQAILDLQGEISSGVAGVASINNVSGAVNLTGLSPITISSSASTSQITVGVSLSVTQNAASGTGTLTYNNGVFTYTPPDLSGFLTEEVNDLTAAVTWANVPDANITQSSVTQHQAALSITESQISDLGNYLDLDDTGEQTIAGDIVISGDLTISGTTTFIDTTHLNIGDNIITLNADLPSTTAPTENAGIEINRGSSTDVSFVWDETADKWTLGSETLIAGTFEGNVTGNVTGSASLNVLKAGDTMTGGLNFDSGSRVRLHSGAFTDDNDRYEIFATGDVMFLQYWDDDQGDGTSLQKVILSLDGTGSQREATLFGDLRLKSGNVANPSYDAVVLDLDTVSGHVDITNVRNGTFSGDLVVGTTNVYDGLPTGLFWDDTDDKFKIGVTANGGNVSGGSLIQPLLLANILNEGYIPYVATGGGGSSIVNSRVSDSWLKLTTDTLELGASDPVSHEIRYARFLWQSGQNDKVSTVYGARDIVASVQYLGGSATAKIEFTTGSGGGRIQFNDEYTFPATDGTSGQVLSTNGSGDLSWVAAGGSADLQDVTDNGATTNNKITLTYNGTSDPYSPLELRGGGTHTGLYINPDNGSQAHVRFADNGTLKWQIRAPFQDSTNTALKFYSWVNSGDMFVFNHDGNLVATRFTGSGTSLTGVVKIDTDNQVLGRQITLGDRTGSSAYNPNTTGLTLTEVAEIRTSQTDDPPALSWHYENEATRHILLESDGTLKVVAPTDENSGVADFQVVGRGIFSDIKVESGSSNSIRIGDGFGSGGTATIHNYQKDLFLQYGNGLTATNLRLGGGGTKCDLLLTDGGGDIELYGQILINRNGNAGNAIDIDHVENANWAFVFKTSTVGNDNHSGFWVDSVSGTPDMRLRSTGSTVTALINSNGTSYINGGNLAIGATTSSSKLTVASGTPTGATTINGDTVIAIDSSANQYLEFRTSSGSTGIMQGILFTDNGQNAFIGYKEYTGGTSGTYGEAIHLAYKDFSASDSNNGIYFGTSTTPEDGVSNVQMFIKGNGMIGIGTDAPTQISSGVPTLTIDNPNSSVLSGGFVYQSNGTNQAYHYWESSYLVHQVQGSGGHSFNQGASVLMRVKGDGNVGIGNTNPDKQLTFVQDTDDAIQIRRLTTSEGNPAIGTGISWTWSSATTDTETWAAIRAIMPGSGNTHLTFSTRDGSAATFGERMRIQDDGNIGIGTNSAGAKLEIFGTGNTLRLDSAANQSKTILLRNVGTATAEIKTDGNLKLWAEDAGRNIYFDTSGGTKMTILSSGNVGIGTTSPSNAKVHIVGDGSYVGNYGYNTLTLEDASGYPGLNFRQGNNNWLIRKSGATQELEFVYSSNASAPGTGTYTRWLRIEAGGMVETINYLKARGVRVGRDFSISNRATVRLDSANTSSPSDILFGHTAAANESSWTGVYWSISSRAASDGQKLHVYRGGGNPVGGSESILMTYDPNLRVGVNNTAPSKSLDVSGTFRATSECDLAKINFETGAYHGIRFRDDSNNNKFKWGHQKTGNYFYLYDYTKGDAVMDLYGNGNLVFRPGSSKVGINTTNPLENFHVSGTTISGAVGTTGTINRTGITNYLCYEARSTSAGNEPSIGFHKEGVFSMYLQAANSPRGLRVLSPSNETAAGLRVEGDVVAFYSDMRLKTKIGDIQDPIGKIQALSGFYYEPNEIAQSYGYEVERRIGLSAQDVKEVVPEAVHDAPIGDGYMAVDYAKLVPVLVEAIKEQQKQIDELKAKLDGSTY